MCEDKFLGQITKQNTLTNVCPSFCSFLELSCKNWLTFRFKTCLKDTSLYSNRKAPRILRPFNSFSALLHSSSVGTIWATPLLQMCWSFASGIWHGSHASARFLPTITYSIVDATSFTGAYSMALKFGPVLNLAASSNRVRSTQIFLSTSKRRCLNLTPCSVEITSPVSERSSNVAFWHTRSSLHFPTWWCQSTFGSSVRLP